MSLPTFSSQIYVLNFIKLLSTKFCRQKGPLSIVSNLAMYCMKHSSHNANNLSDQPEPCAGKSLALMHNSGLRDSTYWNDWISPAKCHQTSKCDHSFRPPKWIFEWIPSEGIKVVSSSLCTAKCCFYRSIYMMDRGKLGSITLWKLFFNVGSAWNCPFSSSFEKGMHLLSN